MTDPVTRYALALEHSPDHRDAVRLYSDKSIRELAGLMHIDRKQLDDCLSGKKRALAVRRALEVELGLPQYHLDSHLDETDAQQP